MTEKETIFEGDYDKEEVDASEHHCDEHEETSEEKKDEMDEGTEDEDVYTEEGRENLVEDGEITPEEEGFMQGAEGTGHKQKKDRHKEHAPEEE
ncbi:hypothetical protein COV11_01035 [Candidatus Woesearchaeota archaeon CG10_big_fil_rev_8_21_14_0_10_30_7]|nr:MAG: hypothetical protein COV11_01035 [Candidatus Woesearchaeota archaeon CG10_big_fil_rev_8_21_14_0_10_30_7]